MKILIAVIALVVIVATAEAKPYSTGLIVPVDDTCHNSPPCEYNRGIIICAGQEHESLCGLQEKACAAGETKLDVYCGGRWYNKPGDYGSKPSKVEIVFNN